MALLETFIGNFTPFLGLSGILQRDSNYKTEVLDDKLTKTIVDRSSFNKEIAEVLENIVEDSPNQEEILCKHIERKLFSNYEIVLDIPPSMKMKEKQELRRKIIDNGGIVSYMVTKKTKFVICLESNTSSMKQKTAKKYGIPIVKEDYINACLKNKKLLDSKSFLISNETQMNGFRKGKIFVSSDVQKQPTTVQVFLNSLPTYPYEELLGYELVKPVVLKGKAQKASSSGTLRYNFCIVELHVASSERNVVETDKQFCVFVEEGHISQQDESIVESKKVCYFLETAERALSVFSQLYFAKCGPPHYMIEVMEILHPEVGSLAFQKLQLELSSLSSHIDKNVLNIVELIWTEAIGHLKKYLSHPEFIPLWKIDEAESILLQIHSMLNEFDSEELLEKLSKEFYSILPHVPEYSQTIKSKQLVAQKKDLCQVLRDMVSVSEAIGWSPKGCFHAKYKALRCHIQFLPSDSEEFNKMNNFVINSQFRETCIKVHNIYAIHRDIEYAEFTSQISNKQLLFHSTVSSNIVGILSRGLKLPRVIVAESGVERTDVGMLGSGIYFTDSASSCIKYSAVNKMRNTRFILVCEVALGKVYHTNKFQISLSKPPEGFESVHGIKTSDYEITDFQDDEFVIYDPCQQQLKYLIEFSLPEDDVKPFPDITELLEEEPPLKPDKNHINLDFETEENLSVESNKKIEAGLKLINNVENIEVPLKSVDVQAKIIDLVSEVIVLQVYQNNNDSSVEAKYIFPLEVGAAVCGFEAFINDKHIVGEIKEKETAHKEYKEAIQKGHGAYLMDEEQPNVFTVSVGNIPPKTTVIIKITYIIELPVIDEVINFNIPGTVAPWHSQLITETQDVMSSVNLMDMRGSFSLKIAVDMPFPIHIISSPTHKIMTKRTETKAVVKLENSILGNGFTLCISLKEVHVPRMWIENNSEEDSQVCMLTFYPEFEAVTNPHPEIIIALDASNSMQGKLFADALKTAVLCLKNLPHNCYFNIVVFGSVFHELFPSSQICNSKNVQKAMNFLKQVTLLGNTEFSRVLKYYQLTAGKGIKNIILLSDGDVNNERIIFKSIKSYSNKVRIFTIGLSSTTYINKHTLQQIANKSGGVYECLDTLNLENWKNMVQKQIMRTTQASLTNVRIEWQNSYDGNEVVIQTPKQIMSIFNGCRQIIYGFCPEGVSFVKLKADIEGQEFETVLYASELNATEGIMLHKLAARSIIRDWEDGLLADDRVDQLLEKKSNREKIIEFSKQFNLVTSLTSFIAVEKRTEEEDSSSFDGSILKFNLLEEIDVDNLLYMSFEDENEMAITPKSEGRSFARMYKKTYDSDSDTSEDYSRISGEVYFCSESVPDEDFGVDSASSERSVSECSEEELESYAFRSSFLKEKKTKSIVLQKLSYSSAKKPASVQETCLSTEAVKSFQLLSASAKDYEKITQKLERITPAKKPASVQVFPSEAVRSLELLNACAEDSEEIIEEDEPYASDMEPISAQVFPTEDVRALKLLSADSEEIIEKPETRRKKRKCRGKSLNQSDSSDIALGAAPLHPPRLLFQPCEPICAMQTENIASLSLHQQSLIKRHRLVDDSSKMSRSKVVKFGDTEIVINDRETEITQKELTTYSIFIELKEWVKCKGGLPLCDFVFTNIQNSAMKENNEELLELLKNVPYCENAISEPEPEILDSDCDDKLRKTIIDMFNIINKNGGFCTEGNLLQKGILKKPFLLYLREAGLNSLGTKASKDIELMVSTLAFLLFCASYFVQFSKKKISGSTEIDKLQHLADFLAETILSEELIAIIKTIKFIICIQHKYSMACQSLGVGKNWEDFILDFIQEPSH